MYLNIHEKSGLMSPGDTTIFLCDSGDGTNIWYCNVNTCILIAKNVMFVGCFLFFITVERVHVRRGTSINERLQSVIGAFQPCLCMGKRGRNRVDLVRKIVR